MEFEAKNLLEPIYFDYTNIDEFVRDYRCALCRSHYVKYPHVDNLYLAQCPQCGPAMEHTCISAAKINEIENGEIAARLEFKQETMEIRCPEIVLKELGF